VRLLDSDRCKDGVYGSDSRSDSVMVTKEQVLSDAGCVLSVSSSQKCAYDGQPAVLSRAASCCPVLSMHRTDGGRMLKLDETAACPVTVSIPHKIISSVMEIYDSCSTSDDASTQASFTTSGSDGELSFLVDLCVVSICLSA
jgi:hypothetical protein